MAKRVAMTGLGRKPKKSAVKQFPKSNPVQNSLQRSLTSDEIGHVAGEIWQLLNDQNGQSLASLKKSINAPDAVILAAIGWLAREGKLQFDARGRNTFVSLR